MKKKNYGAYIALALAVIIAVYGGIYATRNIGKSQTAISEENALSKLETMVNKIDPAEGTPVKSAVEYTEDDTSGDELPDIDTCEVVVEESTDLYAEIFSSPEKAGSGTDGWLTEMAEEFNEAGYTVDGNKVSIRLRTVNSGQAVDYIATGKAVPDGFAPSNELWVAMLNTNGVDTETITDRMVGNVAGIVLSEDKYKELQEEYGTVDLYAITEATENGFAMGYTNPFASSAGLNFLVSTLLRYDYDNPLSDEAVAGFAKFQENVPFVSLTTMQMRTAADKGTLDGFVMEYQTYYNDATLKNSYVFVPYGYRHDNPLVAISSTSEEKKEILQLFADFCAGDEGTALAEKYGFNLMYDYVSENPELSGDILLAAQQLYKENKDSGRPVIAVFVADVSGSMAGDPLSALKESLVNAMQYIDTDNYIGLVSYDSTVTIELPIGQFNLEQQSLFKGSVENLTTGGQTATYDGVLVALSMIEEQLKETPDAVTMVFVLSDGATNQGYSLNNASGVISGLGIPIYTIAYGTSADTDALQQLSDINEAASLDATTDDIVYQLKQLFNASM